MVHPGSGAPVGTVVLTAIASRSPGRTLIPAALKSMGVNSEDPNPPPGPRGNSFCTKMALASEIVTGNPLEVVRLISTKSGSDQDMGKEIPVSVPAIPTVNVCAMLAELRPALPMTKLWSVIGSAAAGVTAVAKTVARNTAQRIFIPSLPFKWNRSLLRACNASADGSPRRDEFVRSIAQTIEAA